MLSEIFYNYAFQTVVKSAAVPGIAAGMLGVLIITKKSGWIAGAHANAALSGMLLAAAFMVIANDMIIAAAACVACIFSFGLSKFISDMLKINKFMVHSLIASVNFGLCIVLFTYLRAEKPALGANMEKFIMGEAATVLKNEADVAFYVCAASVLITLVCMRRFKAVIFSHELSRTTRVPVNFYRALMFFMVAAVTVAGIQTAGILFMGAFFIVPALTARLWIKTLFPAVLLSGFIGGISAAAGGLASGLVARISSGPASVIFAGFLLLISSLFFLRKNSAHNKEAA